MTFVQPIAKIVPGLMSLSLAGHAYKTVPKDWSYKGMKKVKPGDTIKSFTGLMIGIPMIKPVSGMVSAL